MCPNGQNDFDMNEIAPPDDDPTLDDAVDTCSTELDFVMHRDCSFVTRINPPLTKIRECRIRSLTGGSVTIMNLNNEVVDVKSPRIEIRPKIDEENNSIRNKVSFKYDLDQFDNLDSSYDNFSDTSNSLPPSGCQELPGWRFDNLNHGCSVSQMTPCVQMIPPRVNRTQTVGTQKDLEDGATDCPQIRLSATLQFPTNVNHCSVNITATRTTSPQQSSPSPSRSRSPPPPYSDETIQTLFRGCSNNFNGGGIVNLITSAAPSVPSDEDTEYEPHLDRLRYHGCLDSMSFGYSVKDFHEIKKKLRMSGWYYENICWQESTKILKNAAHGRWLLRDSRDGRYEFAISVQTSTGPTSIRIHFNMGQFRLDADSNLTYEVPFFNCIFELIRYYIDYSKIIEKKRKVVWVDYSRRLYNQIYLSEKPLYAKVPNLTHLARLCINQQKLNISMLPSRLQGYCKEYPYTF